MILQHCCQKALQFYVSKSDQSFLLRVGEGLLGWFGHSFASFEDIDVTEHVQNSCVTQLAVSRRAMPVVHDRCEPSLAQGSSTSTQASIAAAQLD